MLNLRHDINTFAEAARDNIQCRLGAGYKVTLQNVLKNNSQELIGLLIRKEGEDIAPNIYINDYYDEYLKGRDIHTIAAQIELIYRQAEERNPEMEVNLEFTFEKLKPNIFYRIINYNANKNLLSTIPHIRFMDLAITFDCLVKDNDDGIGSFRITNNLMNSLGVDLHQLNAAATENTSRLFPASFESMAKMLRRLMGLSDWPMEDDNNNDRLQLYVLSNQKGINGAACILYPGVLKSIADMLQVESFYILPSSIHEVIIVPQMGEHEKLKSMVKEVNHTQVEPMEVLSDSVYIYTKATDNITLA